MAVMIRLLTALALLTPLALTPLTTTAEEAPRAPRLEDLHWLVGHWQGEAPGGGVAEEVWTAPAAGAMMGAFRWTREEKVIVYEFLLLEETEEGLMLRLRHFGQGSVAWEGKESPVDFRARGQDFGAGRAAFQTETEKGWLRLVLRREENGELIVVLEQEGGGALEFRYQKRM